MNDADKVTLMQTGCERFEVMITEGAYLMGSSNKWSLRKYNSTDSTGWHKSLIDLIMALGGDE